MWRRLSNTSTPVVSDIHALSTCHCLCVTIHSQCICFAGAGATWAWMADVKIGIDEFTAKLGSDALPPGAYSSDIRGCQWYQPLISEAHFNIKIVIPALDHYFSAYPIPLERQPLVRETVAALVSLLQALAHTCTMLPDGSGAHEDCATVRRCIDRIKANCFCLFLTCL